MNKFNFFLVTLLGALLSLNVSAQSITFNISLLTTDVGDGTAFGGINTDNMLTGFVTVDSNELSTTVTNSGDTTIIDPRHLDYSFTVGNHDFAYSYDPARDYIANPDFGLGSTTFEVAGNNSNSMFNVTGVDSFTFDQPGDADAFGLNINSVLGTWSAFDDSTGLTISGTSSISLSNVSAVPIPASIWLFGSALASFMGLRKKHA